jgi:hypothetical protein
MELTKIGGECKGKHECAGVFVTDRGTAAVQGVAIVDGPRLPDGEVLVEIPLDVLREAARAVI